MAAKSDFFSLNKEKEILIYGAGNRGRSLAEKLQKDGFHVIGYIDKYVKGIEENSERPIYQLNELGSQVGLAENKVVIICLHNALWHGEVAADLFHKGYDNIIFLPIGRNYEKDLACNLGKIYDSVHDGSYFNLEKIPKYSALLHTVSSCNDAVEMITEKTVTVWMDLLLIYTNNELKKRGNIKTHVYGDVNIYALRPYIELFHYCKYGEGNIDLYIDAFKTVQNSKDIYSIGEFIQDRLMLYEQFCWELNRGMDYFISSAALVKWNQDSKHFNVVEGHHRLIFLMCEGFRLVPVKMSSEDYLKWRNIDQYNICMEYMRYHRIQELKAPVFHPGFYSIHSSYENISPVVLPFCYKLLDQDEVKAISILDISNMQGYYARGFRYLGCENVYCIETDEQNRKLTELLNRLTYNNDIILSSDYGPPQNERFDIVVLNFTSYSKENLSEEVGHWWAIANKYYILYVYTAEEKEILQDIECVTLTKIRSWGFGDKQISVWLVTR